MKSAVFSILFVIFGLALLAQDYGEKVFAPDASAGNYFGIAVALDSDYALIGASGARNELTDGEGGVAYFFKKVEGEWKFLQKIMEPDIYDWAGYGSCVDISPEYAIIRCSPLGKLRYRAGVH